MSNHLNSGYVFFKKKYKIKIIKSSTINNESDEIKSKNRRIGQELKFNLKSPNNNINSKNKIKKSLK